MSDREDKSESGSRPGSAKPTVDKVVSHVTVEALKEFDSGNMDPAESEDKGARTPTSRPTSRQSKTGSQPSSRPVSAASKPTSPAVSGKASPSVDKPLSVQGSRAGSAASGRLSTSDRPASAASKKESERPASGSQKGSDRPGSVTGSRKGSAKSATGSRPGSGLVRPSSGVASRPDTGTGGRPGSMEPEPQPSPDGRVEANRPASRDGATSADRPRTAKTGSRPSSVQKDRAGSGRSRPEDADTSAAGRSGSQGGTADDTETPAVGPETRVEMTDIMDRPSSDLDGGDSEDGSDGDEEEDMGEDESDDSDSEANMVVLDPDHPLMTRFQAALKTHLVKQSEKVSLELRELEEALRTKMKEREDLGVELYGVQQELARFQMYLEKNHDTLAEVARDRHTEEEELTEIQNYYKTKQLGVNEEKKKGAELQGEVENLALRLFYMKNAKEDVRSDIAIMRRAAEKAETEVSKIEIEKQTQDLFVDRLVEKVDKLKEEIAMYEAQLTAQLEETTVAKDALIEAHMEIEAINLEKKQLFQQWTSSLIGMRRRDEAHSAMLEALNQQQQRILSLETEIEGYKKSVGKEQEQNEKLTMILNKTEVDIATVKKQLLQCHAKHDALKAEYATYTRMLHETEQALNRAMTDKTLKLNELNALRKQIEREYQEKVRLEDEIMEKLRSQLTMDKASQYTTKLTSKLRELTKSLEQQMAEVENDISKDSLESSNVRSRIERLQKVMEKLDEEVRRKNEIISKSNNETTRRNAVIERKQNIIDQYNKKLEHMISSAGGVELGPLEITINSLQKSIDARQQEITELQQLWLRQQSELVRISKDKEDQGHDVEKSKKQLTIMAQKKIRIESNIEIQRRETYNVESSLSNMQSDMIKLNTLLHKEKGMQVDLQQGNILMENDFISSLKDAERESIETQMRLESIKEEKERLLNSLVEAERQIMLWEKKTQLARETRSAVDSEAGQGEVRAMKSEIHRMQVRYAQLMKQQEKMIQEMEKSVSRRDTIVTRGDAQSKMHKKIVTKGTFERQMMELRKKIKTTIQDATSCDTDISDMREHQQQLSQQLEEKQINCQHLQSSSDTLDGDVERVIEVKQKNMSDLLSRQQKMKYFQQAKEGKYTMLCRSESSLATEHDKQVDRLQALSAIVDRLNQEYPHVQPGLRKVTLSLGARAGHSEDDA